ncbi:siderophore ABC transporter substrate-binding protein [Vibrio sp. T187]|uniref:siderophore ABC transporter substrate-binding protein n=1 Tax=Vibrio TaxID=662 RepID=UPI0010C9EB24|nr:MULTISPECIES: siderophore ABC transporter substrate-binding protein [Vibrio]MBW3696071.1 siderophore ABC transporter substrate-binding protein [Vibrio sp. T187]
MNRLYSSALVCLFSSTAMAAPVTVEHSLGTTTLEKSPERVVVIGVGALDALDAFGVKPVAVAKAGTLPGYLAKYYSDDYAAAGSLFEPNFENIYMQKPDLIIIGGRAADKYKELSDIAPTVLFAADANKGYWASTQEQWRMLAEIFDNSEKVEQTIDKLDAQFQQIKAYNQKNNIDALTVMSSGSNITTFGAESRFSSIYKDFGFEETIKGIKPTRHGDLISYEFIREANPSTLLVVDRNKLVNKGESNTAQNFENDLVKATDAYQNGSMTFLDVNAWYLSIAGVTATEQMVTDVKQSIGLK